MNKKEYNKKWNRDHPESCKAAQERFKERYHSDPECRARTLAKGKKWRLNRPEKEYERKLKTNYHITLEQHNTLLEKQNGLCAICRRPETIIRNGKVQRLAVDHDRRCCPGTTSCGKCVRGLLCRGCNQGIGQLQDSIEVLTSAIHYIKAHLK